jgi:hypothetical protein
VAIFNSDHLFEQADKLIVSQAGRPRQADIRRAISAAYYAALAIATARAALGGFDQSSQQEQLAFLSLLLFSPRQ